MATVLVVEDEVLIRELVAEELEEAGFTVIVAKHAAHAISLLEFRQDIHLVFTDIDMPGSMDGLKLAAAVGTDGLLCTSSSPQVSEAAEHSG